MINWNKFFTFLEHGKDDSQQLVTESNHGFPMRHSFAFLFQVIGSEVLVAAHHPTCHEIETSPQRLRTPLADSTSNIQGTRLLYGRVNICISSKFSSVFKPAYVLDCSQKMGRGDITDSFDRFEKLQVIFLVLLDFLDELAGDFLELLVEELEQLHFMLDDQGIVGSGGADGISGKFQELFSTEGRFSPSCFELLEDSFYSAWGSFENRMGSGKFFKQGEEKVGEDVVAAYQFREDHHQMLFELGLSSGNLLREALPHPGQGSQVIQFIGDKAVDLFQVFKQKPGNGESMKVISFGLAEGDALGELFDERWVDECHWVLVGNQEGQEVNMVTASRRKTNQGVGIRVNELTESGETFRVHMQLTFTEYLQRSIDDYIVKLILGNVNTHEILPEVFVHGKPHHSYFLFWSPKSYLPLDSGLLAKSTNRDFRDGEQTPFEALRLRIAMVLCPCLSLYHNYS